MHVQINWNFYFRKSVKQRIWEKNRMNRTRVLLLLFIAFQTVPAGAAPQAEHPFMQIMGVQEAYDAIPHERVTFDPEHTASMPPDEAQYLHQLFSLVDLAIVERVETLHWFWHTKGADNQNYDEIIRRMNALQVPGRLKPAHNLVVSAVMEQKAYFDAWRSDPSMKLSSADPHIRSISNKLRQAYASYMQTFPDETPHNKSAFYQHLCALDNI